jgi:hypothetical protein
MPPNPCQEKNDKPRKRYASDKMKISDGTISALFGLIHHGVAEQF